MSLLVIMSSKSNKTGEEKDSSKSKANSSLFEQEMLIKKQKKLEKKEMKIQRNKFMTELMNNTFEFFWTNKFFRYNTGCRVFLIPFWSL